MTVNVPITYLGKLQFQFGIARGQTRNDGVHLVHKLGRRNLGRRIGGHLAQVAAVCLSKLPVPASAESRDSTKVRLQGDRQIFRSGLLLALLPQRSPTLQLYNSHGQSDNGRHAPCNSTIKVHSWKQVALGLPAAAKSAPASDLYTRSIPSILACMRLCLVRTGLHDHSCLACGCKSGDRVTQR